MKSVEKIYREMLDCFAQRTGMRPAEGCDLAARLYAVAAQVYSLYVQAEWLGRQVLPQTAEGEFLGRPGRGGDPLCRGGDGGHCPGHPRGHSLHDGGPGAV